MFIKKNNRKAPSPDHGFRNLIERLEPRLLLSTTASVVTGSPSGLSPAMIQQAYDLKNIIYTVNGKTSDADGAGETIAIVDAFADPTIVSDLETFDANFGITNDNADGQFVLSVETPQGAVANNAGWGLEESLDVEWAHAIAPEANIMLVEAPSTSVTALTSAVVWAASQPGVVAVSMSWGDSPEFAGETAYDPDFTTPSGHEGVTFVAASGDDAQPNFPSTSPNVLAVGGTTLTVDASGDWESESPWSDSGGGTSPYEGTTKPDVAYDADPNTGFIVYDSTEYQGQVGWQTVGGTSAGTPQWAAIVALIDQGRALDSETSLSGPTQTISDLYNLPSTDYNTITGTGNVGLGSPIGEKIISALVGGGITSVGSSNPAAAQLAFAQQPSSSTAGDSISPSIIVDVEDADGGIVGSDDSNVTLSVFSGPGSLSGTLTVAASGGVATFSSATLDKAGTYALQATDGSLTSATSDSFSITAAAPAQLAFVQQPSSATAGNDITPSITVDIKDQFGNLVSSSTSSITLSAESGPGSLSGTTTEAATNGIATFSSVSLTTAGTYTLQASSSGLTSAISSSFNVTAPVPTQLIFITQPADSIAGQTISPALTVDIEDSEDEVVIADNADVTLSVASGPGNPSGTLTVAATNGVATFANVLLDTAGTYTLLASASGLTSATSNDFTISPAAANELVFVQQPTSITAGDAIAPSITLDIEDQFGNIVTTNSSTVTLSAATGPGALSGTTAATPTNGVATFGNLILDKAGTYTLLATDSSLTSATSTSFTVSPSAADQLAFSQQPTNTTAGNIISPSVTVDVEDQFGNLVTTNSSNITLALATGSETLNGTLTVAAANGIAIFSTLSLDKTGTYSLQATATSLASATSSAFTVSPAAASQMFIADQHFVAGQYGPIKLQTALVLEDQFNNVATSNTSDVTQTVQSDSTTTAVSSGVAEFVTPAPGSGTYQFTFTDGSLSASSTNTFVVLRIPLNYRDWYSSIPLPSTITPAQAQSDVQVHPDQSAPSPVSPSFVVAERPATTSTAPIATPNDSTDKNLLDA
jgi:subtilase family serine protease